MSGGSINAGWRTRLGQRGVMTDRHTRERLKILRHDMPNQDRFVRRGNFDEVALGYSEKTARAECPAVRGAA